jgi:hypothetical protein
MFLHIAPMLSTAQIGRRGNPSGKLSRAHQQILDFGTIVWTVTTVADCHGPVADERFPPSCTTAQQSDTRTRDTWLTLLVDVDYHTFIGAVMGFDRLGNDCPTSPITSPRSLALVVRG